ncbi:unnamed protein product [Nippostrongylus brasiliensis]|uniref:Integrase_SAM-like_N domain-containing protein n=1 Tax=Nippostrongylus brasiliensis TaxID=27835 RepID=A0A0N4YEV0_NIPBR|nr:unnamed protein product [Nippostrongylus brasiliensis]
MSRDYGHQTGDKSYESYGGDPLMNPHKDPRHGDRIRVDPAYRRGRGFQREANPKQFNHVEMELLLDRYIKNYGTTHHEISGPTIQCNWQREIRDIEMSHLRHETLTKKNKVLDLQIKYWTKKANQV